MRLLFSNSGVLKSVINFNNLRTMTSMPKVYVRHVEYDEKLKINFTFSSENLPNRNFAFIRNKDETLEITIARMKLKISEYFTKKATKRKKKDKNDVLPQESIPISLTVIRNQEPLDVGLKNIEAWNTESQLKINGVVYEIVENPPTVLHISLPKSIMAGFPVYPKIQLEFCAKMECTFSWFRSLTKSEKENKNCTFEVMKYKNESWCSLPQGYFYMTTESDANCRLRVTCLPKCGDKEGTEEEAISVNLIQLGPSTCPFEIRHRFTKDLTKPGSFRCMTYNILADLYADTDTARNDLFPYCPTEALTLDYRKQLFLKEIIGYNADLICLQEVDRRVFYGDLVPVLSVTGLEGLYSEKGGQVVEGLACFFRKSKFRVIKNLAIILSDAVKSEPVLQPLLLKISENEKLAERFMNRTTALQVVLLESIDTPKKRILIGNTHLYFHPDSDNIRLIQGATCITFLENLLNNYKNEDPSCDISLILSGDFNSCPEFGLYELMTKGILNEDCVDWKSNPEEVVPGLTLQHSLLLRSACGTPEYTNFTEGFVGCLDYIFYDESALKVCDIVPHPSHDEVVEYKALPNKVFPSDHIAQICTLEWK